MTPTKNTSKPGRKKPEDIREGTGPLETKSVVFVEHTIDGMLAKRAREQLG